MPRLNIYIPDDLANDLYPYREAMNLSEICANAIRSELRSRATARAQDRLPGAADWTRTAPEAEIARRWDLRMVRVVPCEAPDEGREPVAIATAEFLDALVRDGMHIAMGGGAQLCDMVRHLRPRNVRAFISALGFGHVDREIPHVHANALVTRLSLLYARSSVALVGDSRLREQWPVPGPKSGDEVIRVILGGCGRWRRDTPLGRVLGDEICDVLDEKGVVGDFLGVFLGGEGESVEPYLPSAPVSHIGSAGLYAYAKRPDTLVVLVASHFMRLPAIKRALELKLCNALILDSETASVLISHGRGSPSAAPA